MISGQAKRFLFVHIFILASVFALSAQNTVNIYGRITDSSGSGVEGADVTLKGQSMSGVTDSDGYYIISGEVGIEKQRISDNAVPGISLKDGKLMFRVAEDNTPVKISLYNILGQSVKTFNEKKFSRGNHKVKLTGKGLSSRIYFLNIEKGRMKSVYKCSFVDGRMNLSSNRVISSKRNTSLDKAASAVDTIVVTAQGYINGRSPAQQFEDTVNVTILPQIKDTGLTYSDYSPGETDVRISRSEYINKLHGFWLAECIANWTGLITEMDKIGNIGSPQTGDFYTDDDWGGMNGGIWDKPSEPIDFKFTFEGTPWGADDDTDMEYMYQHLLYTNNASILTGDQIRAGWLEHIWVEEENYLWVSNQRAFDLMGEGMVPPNTSLPENNTHYEMIDAQLTTEIFGLFAPARPDIALEISYLPIRATAYEETRQISQFYVIMHSLASYVDKSLSMKEQVFWLANEARNHLPNEDYPAAMFDFVWGMYNQEGMTWETVRDAIYERYQVNHPQDGYDLDYYTQDNPWCNACFAGGINYAASLMSLFFGEGDLPRTIQIAVLAGWDSDNPAATWAGLLGSMLGKEGVEEAFAPYTDGNRLSGTYWIHRTRQNFPDHTPGIEGEDSFPLMGRRGVYIIDRVVQEEMGGGVDPAEDVWYIPDNGGEF